MSLSEKYNDDDTTDNDRLKAKIMMLPEKVKQALPKSRVDEALEVCSNIITEYGSLCDSVQHYSRAAKIMPSVLADEYMRLRDTTPIDEQFAEKVNAIEGWSLYKPSAKRNEWYLLIRMRTHDSHVLYVDAAAPNQGFVRCQLLAAGIECEV